MPKKSTVKLIDEVRSLPESDRIRLLEELLSDLDGPAASRSEAEWEAIVARRSGEVKAGTVDLMSWDEVQTLKARRRRSR